MKSFKIFTLHVGGNMMLVHAPEFIGCSPTCLGICSCLMVLCVNCSQSFQYRFGGLEHVCFLKVFFGK